MDLIVMAMVAMITAIIAVLAAVFNRKRFRVVLIYAGVGLMAGLPLGYVIAPFIISFM